MNHEAKLLFLRRIRREVRDERNKLAGGAPDLHSAARAALLEKVAGWEARLQRFEKAVKSDLHLAAVQTGGRRHGADYSQRQAWRSRQRNAEGLRAEAAAVAAEIAALLAALDPASLAWKRLVEAMERLAQAGGDDVRLDSVELEQVSRIVEQAAPGSAPRAPGAPGGAPVVDVLTIVLALWAILKGRLR